jgi:hypothetical protein
MAQPLVVWHNGKEYVLKSSRIVKVLADKVVIIDVLIPKKPEAKEAQDGQNTGEKQ